MADETSDRKAGKGKAPATKAPATKGPAGKGPAGKPAGKIPVEKKTARAAAPAGPTAEERARAREEKARLMAERAREREEARLRAKEAKERERQEKLRARSGKAPAEAPAEGSDAVAAKPAAAPAGKRAGKRTDASAQAGAASDASQPPATYHRFVERYPKLGQAWNTVRESEKEGPLDRKARRLVKLAVALGAMREGAVHSAARKARAAGATPEEILQVVALSAATLGFPSTVAVFTWVEDVLGD